MKSVLSELLSSQGIALRRFDFDDDAWHMELTASNGRCMGTQEFYEYPESIEQFSRALTRFPEDVGGEVRFELGGPSKPSQPNWAYYILLRAYIYESVGHCAVQFAADNNSKPPHGSQSNFSILCEVAAVNRLGEQLLKWLPNPTQTLLWTANPSRL